MFFDSEDATTHGVDGVVSGAMDGIDNPTPGRLSKVLHTDKTGMTGYHDEREYKPMCEDRARNGYNSGMGEIFRKVCAVAPISEDALSLPSSSSDDSSLSCESEEVTNCGHGGISSGELTRR